MPFKSESQRRFMFLKHKDIAEKWSREYPNQGRLPEKATMSYMAKKRKSKKY